MDSLNQRMREYFATRTEGGNGIIKDFIFTESHSHTIFVCDNDYLNLGTDERVLQHQIQDLQKAASRDVFMSPTFIAEDDMHSVLEREMSAHFGKECMLAQSGYVANTGLMSAICDEGTHVYVDKLLHMSFHEGLRARGAKIHYNAHNDIDRLEANVQAHGPGIIIVESLYSVTGTFTPLQRVVDIKERYGCVLVLDESHTLGLYSDKGYASMLGLDGRVEFITASLAKGYCTRAGIIMAPNTVFIKENSFPFIFSSALVRNDVTRLRAVFELVKAAEDRRERLMVASGLMRRELIKVAKVVDTSTPSPIIAIRTKDEDEMARLHRHLSRQGIMAAPFCSPATPKEAPVIRMTVHSNISIDDITDITRAVASFYNVARL